MHNAPAVNYPVGRSFFHAAAVACSALVGLATLLAWIVQSDAWLPRHTVAWLVWVFSLGWAAWGWWRSPQGALEFTGDSWHWVDQVHDRQVTLTVQLDLQHTLLVLARDAQSRGRWLWLTQARQPRHWGDLRRALFATLRDRQVQGHPEVSA